MRHCVIAILLVFTIPAVNQAQLQPTWTKSGLDGYQGVMSLIIDPGNPSAIYAATNGFGVFKSTDAGATWQAVNNGIAELGIFSLAIDPTTSTTFYATYGCALSALCGGVYKTTNGGANWQAVNNGLPSAFIWSVAVDPKNPANVYVGSDNRWVPGGIFKTTDGGTSWSRIWTSSTVASIAVDPNNSQIVYAGTVGGLLKSIDGGTNWQSILGASTFALAFDNSNPRNLYAGTSAGVWKTIDGGTTWTSQSIGEVFALAADPTNAPIVYAGTRFGGVFKSTDHGDNWQPINDGLPTTAIRSLAINPSTGTVYAGTDGSQGVFRLGSLPPPATGTITVTTNLAAATFTLTGPATYTGTGTTFSQANAPSGTYTITYGSVSGFATPPSEAKTLTAAGTIAFTAAYQPVVIPSLIVTPATLSFEYQAGTATAPPVQPVTITASTGTLAITVSSSTTSGGNWLTVTPLLGTTPQTVSVGVTPGLSAGTYGGMITVTAIGAGNSPQNVNITLSVKPPSTGTITVTTNLPTASFTIIGTLTYTGTGISFSEPNAPPGTYTIQYSPVSGYTTPVAETKTLIAGNTVSFTGKYQPPPQTLRKPPYDFFKGCNDSSELGETLVITESTPKTGELRLRVRAAGLLSSNAKGKAGVGITYTPQFSGRIRIKTFARVGPDASLDVVTASALPILGIGGIASIESDVFISTTEETTVISATTERFRYSIVTPLPGIIPFPISFEQKIYRPAETFSAELVIPVTIRRQVRICAGIQSKAVATAFPWVFAFGLGVYSANLLEIQITPLSPIVGSANR